MFKSNDEIFISISKLAFLRYFKDIDKKFAFFVGQN
jgi:hypothetical protein